MTGRLERALAAARMIQGERCPRCGRYTLFTKAGVLRQHVCPHDRPCRAHKRTGQTLCPACRTTPAS